MIKIIKNLYFILSHRERQHLFVLVAMISSMAVLDALGVASILPFMAVLTNPELVQTNNFLNWAFRLSHSVGVETTNQFLFVLGVMVLVLFVAALMFKVVTTYAQTKFALMCESNISSRLVEAYLRQKYSWFLGQNSAELGKAILTEVHVAVDSGLLPLMTAFAQGAVTLSILALLVVVDGSLAIAIGLTLGCLYLTIYFSMSGWLKRLGHLRIKANQARFKLVSEAFGAIKEIKVAGLEVIYTKHFRKAANDHANGQAMSRIIGQLPRFVLEAIAFGGLLLILLYKFSSSQGVVEALPIMALYALAGYRLMPALQQIYQAFTQLRFVGPALDTLVSDLNNRSPKNQPYDAACDIKLKKEIKLDGVSYAYPDTTQPALKELSFIISAGSKVGFVGPTGSGKTTVLDVILGVLAPQHGTLSVDGLTISERNLRSWQRAIGYVPQDIYLLDDTIAANIAFCANANDIDLNNVERAAKLAHLHEFVTHTLPDAYSTMVGERGVRLSGGQRQRIGIARALYQCPQILILDEATSALDNVTEHKVMESINSLGSDITIILIAHRLSTVRQCDEIYLLVDGQIAASGTYDRLVKSSETFAALAAET